MLASFRWNSRGEVWVAAQLALMTLIVLAGALPAGWPGPLRWSARILGLILGGAGIAIAIAASTRLGPSLTMFPRPKAQGELVETGLYGVVRHPIYGAGLLAFGGYGLAATSWPSLALVAVLACFWAGKARREEAWLRERYPQYDAYRRRVRRRFVPGLY